LFLFFPFKHTKRSTSGYR